MILALNLFQAGVVDGAPKHAHDPVVQMMVVLVPCLINEVKISVDGPWIRWWAGEIGRAHV